MARLSQQLGKAMNREEKTRCLYERHYPSVVGFFVRRFHVPREDARDWAQDVFVRVFKSMDLYRNGDSWSFIQKIARNLALNKFRDRTAIKRFVHEVPLEALPPSIEISKGLWNRQALSNPDGALIEKEKQERRSRRLHAALMGLTEINRNCFLLRMNGLQYLEIAEALGLSLDAVRARLNEVKASLHKKLGEELEGLD